MPLERPASADLAVRLFGPSPARTLALLKAAWPLAVGAELARRTEVLAVEGTTLRVRVPDASWRKGLLKMRGQLLGRLRRVAGELAPGRLAFSEGPLARPPEPPAVTLRPQPSGAPPPAVVVAAERIADADVRALFLECAGRYLTRSRS